MDGESEATDGSELVWAVLLVGVASLAETVLLAEAAEGVANAAELDVPVEPVNNSVSSEESGMFEAVLAVLAVLVRLVDLAALEVLVALVGVAALAVANLVDLVDLAVDFVDLADFVDLTGGLGLRTRVD